MFFLNAFNKESLLFQLVRFKIYAIIKTVYSFNWLLRRSAESIYWNVFLKINRNQKTIKLYTTWDHWYNWRRLTIRKHALLWNKYQYQHSADIFVKIIVNPFMALVSLYTPWNTSEKQRFSDNFREHRKRPVLSKALRVIQSSVTYFVTYISNWRYFIQPKSFLQIEIITFPYQLS